MASVLTTDEVMRIAEMRPNLPLFTLADAKLFHVRVSNARPPWLRFDRYATDHYDTIKRADVEAGVAVFNRLAGQDRMIASRYKGDHRAASYLAAFLVYCAKRPTAISGPENEESAPEFSGQGIGLTPAQRKAVEDWGMERAGAHYAAAGWAVAIRGKPFDLLCTNEETGERRYVEVKASTGALNEILVTAGEIRFACKNWRMVDLFLLEHVELRGNRASGGTHRVGLWNCDEDRAKATHYRYRITDQH